jgi:hypothetical protein
MSRSSGPFARTAFATSHAGDGQQLCRIVKPQLLEIKSTGLGRFASLRVAGVASMRNPSAAPTRFVMLCWLLLQVVAPCLLQSVPSLLTLGLRMYWHPSCCALHVGCCLPLLLPAICWVALLLCRQWRPAGCGRSSCTACGTCASGEQQLGV